MAKRRRDRASPNPGSGPSPSPAGHETSPPGEVTSPATAEKVWEVIVAIYRTIEGLINSLPPAERHELAERFQGLVAEEVPKWWAAALQDMKTPQELADFLMRGFAEVGLHGFEETCYAINNLAKGVESKVKDHYTRKARKTVRDDEIVRLRDENGLSWAKIHKEICKNPAWAKTGPGNKKDKTDQENEKEITQGALRAAYSRRKKQLQAPRPSLRDSSRVT
jgi:hypothetical protein